MPALPFSKPVLFSSRSLRKGILVLSFACFALAVRGQTFLGPLSATDPLSTFEGLGPATLGTAALGNTWSSTTGTGPQIFNSTNDGVMNATGSGFSPYGVQFTYQVWDVMNHTDFTVSARMGYFSASGTGNANYSLSLGSWHNGTFTTLQTISGTVPYMGDFGANGNNSITVTLNFFSTTSTPGKLAIRWNQTNTSTGAEYLGFDNVTVLALNAVPEPSTYAAIFGAATLGFAAWRKRRSRG